MPTTWTGSPKDSPASAFSSSPAATAATRTNEAIALFFRRYEKRNAPGAPELTRAAPAPISTDHELLGVFLEEAGEVLQTIESTLPVCREKPDDQEALTTLRRAFHTLKGSGRMVGLKDLGEAAWEVEQVMNAWLEQKRPVTQALLELLDTATASFSKWVGELKSSGQSSVEATRIVELAARAKAVQQDVVTVGTVTVTRGLYDIYTKEAAEHIAVLRAECTKWRDAAAGTVSADFMRAAHTLASTSRTAGFIPLADLAAALEHWSGYAKETTDAADAETIQAAVVDLGIMVEAISKGDAPAIKQMPQDTLRSLIGRLESARVAALRPPPAVVPPAPPVQPPDGREKRRMHDDIDAQLLPIFLEEAQQIVPDIGSDLREWKANPSDVKVTQSLRRSLHTLKGSARMAGAIRLGELCHLMESRIEAALEAGAALPAELFEYLEEHMDRLSIDVERMAAGPAAPEPAPPAAAFAPEGTQVQPQVQARAEPPLPSPAALLRVNADTARSADQRGGRGRDRALARRGRAAQRSSIRSSTSRRAIARLRGQLREIEVQADSQMQSRLSVMDEKKGDFDPLEFDRYTRLQELTRLMAESLNDVLSIQQALHKNIGDTDAALLAAGAHQPRGAAGPDARARGAVLEPERAPVPHRAPDRARARQEGRARGRGRGGRARPQRARAHRRAARAHAAQRPGARHRGAGGARRRRQGGDRRIAHHAAPGEQRNRADPRRTTAPGLNLERCAQGRADGPAARRARAHRSGARRNSSSPPASRPPRRSPRSPAAASAWTW